jgi:hypothetical protein
MTTVVWGIACLRALSFSEMADLKGDGRALVFERLL